MHVAGSSSGHRAPNPFRVFVCNVAPQTTVETLVTAFGSFGQTRDVYYPRGKGYSFVEFMTERSAAACRANAVASQLVVDGRVLRVDEPTQRRGSGSASSVSSSSGSRTSTPPEGPSPHRVSTQRETRALCNNNAPTPLNF